MRELPLRKVSHNFESLEKVLKGEKRPQKVHFVELGVDKEIIKYVTEKMMGGIWTPLTEEFKESYQKQKLDFYYKMGYDYVPLGLNWINLPKFKERKTTDTSTLSRGQRSWVEEGGGIIKNWKDFERVDWDDIKTDLRKLDYLQRNLPDGMKITIITSLFEMILEKFLGYEDLFILSYDNPKLVEAVFEKWGQKVYDAYKQAVQYPRVGAIFHADDLGHKTGTMLSLDFLKRNVFPWFKRYASLAHQQDKMYWYHCCGNVSGLIDHLIKDIQIDAFHSFQDEIIPVGNFIKKYGDRVAALGGIDMDRLTRMGEQELRKYVRDILDECMPGRYALGSGNTIANYIPVRNYFVMLEEAMKWKG